MFMTVRMLISASLPIAWKAVCPCQNRPNLASSCVNQQASRIFALFLLMFFYSGALEANNIPDSYWENITGLWETGQLSHRFKQADRISFYLWLDVDKGITGIGAFIKGNQRCVGYLTTGTDITLLKFSPVEGDACNGLENSYFAPAHSRQRPFIMLSWFPAEVKNPYDYQDPAVMQYRVNSMASFVKSASEHPPDYVNQFLESNKGQMGDIKNEIIETIDAHQTILKKLTSQFASENNLSDKFPEEKLIGAWKGQIVDKFDTFPAEIVLWPAQVFRLQKIVGVIYFEGKQCVTGVNVSISNVGEVTLFLSDTYLKDPTSHKCIRVNGVSRIKLGQSKDQFYLTYHPRSVNLNGTKEKTCIDQLSKEQCQYIGYFNRAGTSQIISDIRNRIKWSYNVPEPDEVTWSRIISTGNAFDEIEAEYRALANNNDAVRAQIQAEAEEERDREWQRKLEEYRKKFANRNASKIESDFDKINIKQDIKESRRIVSSLNGPFDQLPAGDYLNAIYSGDATNVRHADKIYLYGLEPAIDISEEYFMNFVMPILAWSSGGLLTKEPVQKMMDNSRRKVSFFNKVLAMYIRNYQDSSKKCLNEDHPSLVLTYKSGERKIYGINENLAEIALGVGKFDPETSPSGSLVDALYNQGKYTSLIQGTQQMMQSFSCDSPEIKRMEENMIKLYEVLK